MPHAAGLHYQLHGPEDGPALVLSAGLGGQGGYWAPNIDALSAHHRVLAYDQRGTGASEDLRSGPLSVEDMAADLLALLDALGIASAALVGHALGAHIGLALALAAPNRLSGLVAINAWPSLDLLTARCFDVRLALLRDSGPEAFFLAQPLFLYPGPWISRHDAALRDEAAVQLSAFRGADTVERRIAALRAFDPSPGLARTELPVLAVSAEDDMLVPANSSRRLAAALPRGEHQALAWGGHACNVTDPDRFNSLVLAWLRGRARPSSGA